MGHLTLHVVAIEATDEAHDLAFKVETFDSGAATVELRQATHNAASWAALAADVGRAIAMLNLEPDDPAPIKAGGSGPEFVTAVQAGLLADDGRPCLNDHDPQCDWPRCNCRQT